MKHLEIDKNKHEFNAGSYNLLTCQEDTEAYLIVNDKQITNAMINHHGYDGLWNENIKRHDVPLIKGKDYYIPIKTSQSRKSVYSGIMVYQYIGDAMKACGSSETVVKCIIPRHAKMWYSNNGIVVVDNIVTHLDPVTGKDRFKSWWKKWH